MTGWVVPTGCELVPKTCRGCLKKGHILFNNVEKALWGKMKKAMTGKRKRTTIPS